VVPGLEPKDAAELRQCLAAAVAGVPLAAAERHEDLGPLRHEDVLDATGGDGVVVRRVLGVEVNVAAVAAVVRAREARRRGVQVEVDLLAMARAELARGGLEPAGR